MPTSTTATNAQSASKVSKSTRGKSGSGRGYRGRGGRSRGGRYGGRPRMSDEADDLTDSGSEIEIDNKPRELFPERFMPYVKPPTEAEKAQVLIWRRVRQRIREGPLYTVFDENGRDIKAENRKKAKTGAEIEDENALSNGIVNPFEDMPSYTQKYKPVTKGLPDFSTRPYCLQLFPRELWSVIEPKKAKPKAKKPNQVKPKRAIDRLLNKVGNLDEEGEDAVNDAEMVELDEEADPEANPEDDFEEADSDMGADYNAEQYFDDGDGDGDDGDDGGGEDAGFD